MFSTTGAIALLAMAALTVNIIDSDPVAPNTGGPTSFTVAPDGGDFDSIQSAVDAAADGDTIYVMPGTYSESVSIEGKEVRLLGESLEGEVRIDAPTDAPTLNVGATPLLGDDDLVAPYALLLKDTDSLVSGFVITGPDDAVVVLSGGEPRLRLSVVGPTMVVTDGAVADIAGNDAGTIRVLGASSPAIVDNDLRLVWLEDHAYPTEINDNMFVGGGPEGVEMAIFVANDGQAIVQGNTITDPGLHGIKVGHSTMQRSGDGSVTIANNTISGARQAGIEIHQTGIASVMSNTLIDNRIGVIASGGAKLVERNVVEGSRTGIVISTGSPSVVDNTVRRSDVGITVGAGSSPELSGNRLCDDNGQGVVVGSGANPVIDGSNEICDTRAGG